MNTVLKYVLLAVAAFAVILVLTDGVMYGWQQSELGGIKAFVTTLSNAVGIIPLWSLSMVIFIVLALIDTILNLIFRSLLGLNFNSSIADTWVSKGGVIKLPNT